METANYVDSFTEQLAAFGQIARKVHDLNPWLVPDWQQDFVELWLMKLFSLQNQVNIMLQAEIDQLRAQLGRR